MASETVDPNLLRTNFASQTAILLVSHRRFNVYKQLIDEIFLGYCDTEASLIYTLTEHEVSPSITTDPSTFQNKRKFVYLVMRIGLTRAILIPQHSDFLRNSTIQYSISLYLATCFVRVTVSLLWRSQAVSTIHFQISPYLIISEGSRKFPSL